MLSRRSFLVAGAASVALPIGCTANAVAATDLQKRIDAARGSLELPAGIFDVDALRLPPSFRLTGAGIGKTIIRLAPRARGEAIIHSDTAATSAGLSITALTLDGNAAHQDKVCHGILLISAEECTLSVAVRNCKGSGIVLNRGRNNIVRDTQCQGNGRAAPGYGLYLYGCSDTLVERGNYDDNCIGIAVEAAGRDFAADRNQILSVSCARNRADFGQSGAGIHFEATEGGRCAGGEVHGARCSHSTGIGINNTGCDLQLYDCVIADNSGSGIVTSGATGFAYHRLILTDNSLGAPKGYGGELRFDDSGIEQASSGLVEDCILSGTTTEGAIRTMSRFSEIDFDRNHLSGYPHSYVFAGNRNRRDRKATAAGIGDQLPSR